MAAVEEFDAQPPELRVQLLEDDLLRLRIACKRSVDDVV